MLYCKFPLVSLDVLNFKADAQLSGTIEADQEAPIAHCENVNYIKKVDVICYALVYFSTTIMYLGMPYYIKKFVNTDVFINASLLTFFLKILHLG